MECEAYLNRADHSILYDSKYRNFLRMRDLGVAYDGHNEYYPSRTLDQSYYGKINDLAEKDNDQVVFRFMGRTQSKFGLKVVTVPQLWLWKIDKSQ